MVGNGFLDKLNGVAGSMNEKEIYKAIDELCRLREKVYTKEKEIKLYLSQLLNDYKKNEAVLTFSMTGQWTGRLKVYGAGLLKGHWCNAVRTKRIPDSDMAWWMDGYSWPVVKDNGNMYYMQNMPAANIRPVLILPEAGESFIERGDVFFINGQKFKQISEYIAIRYECLDAECSRSDIDNGLGQCIVNEWYRELIEDNE